MAYLIPVNIIIRYMLNGSSPREHAYLSIPLT
jgi:hypothetical protein